jgi:hypothetical protein
MNSHISTDTTLEFYGYGSFQFFNVSRFAFLHGCLYTSPQKETDDVKSGDLGGHSTEIVHRMQRPEAAH